MKVKIGDPALSYHHEIHMFTAVVPDKVKVKDQNMQTETVEIKHQHVQAKTRAQEQGMLLLGNTLHQWLYVLYMTHKVA